MKTLGCLTSTTAHLKHSVWLLVLVMWSVPVEASDRPCAYDEQVHGYIGTPVEQARCLMRPVQKWGRVSDSRPSLPPPLESLIGKTVTLSTEQFRTYIASLGITEKEVGGSLSDPLVRTSTGRVARYFVVHDTSSCVESRWPADLDVPNSRFNRRILNADLGVAHMFINRVGVMRGDGFGVRRTGTKFTKLLHRETNGLFLHTELYQPRLKRNGCESKGAEEAPQPGFSDEQYSRLALLYIAASVRNGEWMIPAYHAVVDLGIPGGHDDPQNFSVDSWSNWILRHTARAREGSIVVRKVR